MNILSPITLKNNVEIIQSVAVSTIIELYRNELGIDVAEYFSNIDQVHICRCKDSEYVFYYPGHLEGDDKFYDKVKLNLERIYHSPYYPPWKWDYEIAQQFIKPTDRVYEIGCGEGYFLRHLVGKGSKHVGGSELNPESVAVGRNKGLEIELVKIEDKALTHKGCFDVVCCFQVLEHVSNVKSFITSSLKILRSGGYFIIAVPYNKPLLFNKDIYNTLNLPPHHMGLWNDVSLKNLGNYFDLKLHKCYIESLPKDGYDFERYFTVNKDTIVKPGSRYKNIADKVYRKLLRRFHNQFRGKNIVAVFKKV